MSSTPTTPTVEKKTTKVTSDKLDDYLKELVPKFKDVPRLLDAIKRRFPGPYWPQKDNRKIFSCIDKILGICGGENNHTELLRAYLDTSHRKKIGTALYNDNPDYELLLTNIKLLLAGCRAQVKVKGNHDPVINSIRINLLKALSGIKGKGRNILQNQGFDFSTSSWTKAQEEIKAHGMSLYMQDSTTGRKGVGKDLREAIRTHVLTDTNSKVLPGGRHKVSEARL